MTNQNICYGSFWEPKTYVKNDEYFFYLVWFLLSNQQSFSYVGTGLPELNQN